MLKNGKWFILVLSAAVCFLLSCKDDSNPAGPQGDDIEIIGTWTGTDVNTGSPVDFTITISNSKMDWDYGGSSMSADIGKYDNFSNYCVVRWISHPAYTGMYSKFAWLSEPAATVTIQVYSEENTQSAAENSTNAKYTPIELTKSGS